MTDIKYLWTDVDPGLEDIIKDLLQANAIYTITNSDGIIEYANANYCNLLGRDPQEVIWGPNYLLKSEGLDTLKHLKLWQAINQGHEWKGVLVESTKDFHPIWLKTKIIPIRSNPNESFRFLSIHQDISDLKNRCETIKNDSAMYHQIYDSVKIGIVVVLDRNGHILKWNKGAESSFGYSAFDVLGKPLAFLMAKKYRKEHFADFLRLLERYKRKSQQDLVDLKCINHLGEEFPVEIVLSKWTIREEDFYGVKMLDISKRMAFQKKLEQKTKELELFLYRSAHDLNTPFASAQGLINLMKDLPTDHRMEELIQMLEKTLDRAKVLSNGLAKASMASNLDTMDAVRTEIDFDELLQNVVEALKTDIAEEKLQIRLDIQKADGFVSYPELLSTLFEHLLHNAIKFTDFKNKKKKPIVAVNVAQIDKELVIKVCDNGRGIKKQHIDRIFELYYRAEAGHASRSHGLGLYIVKKIVDGLNGTIHVESKFNKGACFLVKLPLTKF